MNLNDENSKFHSYSKLLTYQIEGIASDAFNSIEEIGFSFCSGMAGLSILTSCLDVEYKKPQYNQKTQKLVFHLLNYLEKDIKDISLSNGLSGIAFCLHFIKRTNPNIILDEVIFDSIDEFIEEKLNETLESEYWDPLHGLVGIGLYFIERNSSKTKKDVLNRILHKLSSIRKQNNGFNLWYTPSYKNISKESINFGMAHGVPGVISFLAKLTQIEIKNSTELLMESISVFDFYRNSNLNDISYSSFPSYINTNDNIIQYNSRLAWCYGDLCVANSYIHAYNATKRDDYLKKAREIIINSLKRIDKSGCIDASFCHGMTGLIHQYYQYYKIFKSEEILNTIYKLLDENLNLYYNNGRGIGGYLYNSYDSNSNKRIAIESSGILEGSVGIAMVYLSLIEDMNNNWDLPFLTNIYQNEISYRNT